MQLRQKAGIFYSSVHAVARRHAARKILSAEAKYMKLFLQTEPSSFLLVPLYIVTLPHRPVLAAKDRQLSTDR